LKRFGALTGVPILINTSFNENEPIVNTPAQAIDCFQRTNMDSLAIGSFLVLKSADTRQRESAQIPVGVTAD
jgi:carbamoyltransferase